MELAIEPILIAVRRFFGQFIKQPGRTIVMEYSSNIWKFYLYTCIGSLEFVVSVFVLFMLANNLSMTEVMILESLFIIAVFVLEVPSGGFADRLGRKRSLMISSLFACVSFVVFGLGSNFWVFLAAQILLSGAWAFASGADSALIYDSLKESGRERESGKVLGRMRSIQMFTLGIMGLVSGYLGKFIDYRMLFFLTSISFFMGFLIALTFKEPPMHKHLQEKNYFRHLWGAIRFSLTHRWIRTLVIYYGVLAGIVHLTFFLIQPFFPSDYVGFATMFFFTCAGAGLLAAEHFFWVRKTWLMTLMLAVPAIAYVLMYYSGAVIAIALLSIIAFVSGVKQIFAEKSIHEHTESHHRATVISVQSMSKSVVYAVFAPLIGLVTDIYSPGAAFFMMGLGLFAFLIVFLLVIKKNK
ncbi:MAG: MFS transporter [archaeon]